MNFADLDDLVIRMKAVQGIVHEPDFETLMVGFKRAHRIVEKEDKPQGDLNLNLLKQPAEEQLAQVVHNGENKGSGIHLASAARLWESASNVTSVQRTY